MAGSKKQQIDREAWSKISFYIDIIVFAIIAICIYLLVQHSYYAGMYMGEIRETQELFLIAFIVAVLAICLTWVFVRIYRYRGELEKRYS